MKHLIDPMDLSVQEVDELLDLADDIIALEKLIDFTSLNILYSHSTKTIGVFSPP